MTEQLSDREFPPPPPPFPAAEDAAGAASGTQADGDAADTSSGSEEPGEVRRSRRGRRGGRRRSRSRQAAGATAAVASAPDSRPDPEGEGGEGPEDSEDEGAEEPTTAGTGASAAAGEGLPRRKRRRGRRGGRRRRGESSAEEAEPREPGESEDGEGSPDAPQGEEPGRPRRSEEGEKRQRKRGSRGGRRRKKGGAVSIEVIPGDDDELPELQELPEDSVLVDSAEEDDDERPAREAPRGPRKRRVILVNACDTEEKRVAVVEEGRIVDLQMTVRKHVSYVNDIYRGRVVNLETAIGAAFVDFGEGRNGFLHTSDVLPSYGESDWSLEKLLSTPVAADAQPEPHEPPDGEGEWEEGQEGDEEAQRPAPAAKERDKDKGRARPRGRMRIPVEKLLKKGQMVAVQITKDAIGDKGPTLTTYVSIPGRYLVLMPSLERTGVSRKIDDERERRRLKRILQSLEIPDGMGVIVRTAGIGRTKTEIKRDLDYLLLAWEDFSKHLRTGRNPAPLYQESDVAIRTMRDLFTPETESVIVDDPEVFQRMVEFTKRLMPEHLDRVKMHEGARPLFHAHGVEQDFEKIFARRVELPSGGSIVIEQTEALVAIDVNSGRTREEGAEFEDIALKTNLEAVPEIARQIRLRDLGGIIVLDYIDMMRSSSRKAVERATRDALKTDRARAKIGRISQFGLLELTRQRLGPGLSKLVYDSCSRCRGTGRRRNAASRAQAIMRRLAAALALKGYTSVEVRTHPDAIEHLQREMRADLDRLQQESGREIKLLSVPEQVEDSVLHYLRADGREVRPGGRRRR